MDPTSCIHYIYIYIYIEQEARRKRLRRLRRDLTRRHKQIAEHIPKPQNRQAPNTKPPPNSPQFTGRILLMAFNGGKRPAREGGL